MQTTSPIVHQFHEAYSQATNFRLPLNYDRIDWWERLAGQGVTLEDLKLVLRYLQFQIAKGKRFDGCLRFSNLIGYANRFDEELGLARAWARNAKPPPTVKDRYAPPMNLNTSKTAGQVMATSAQITELLKAAHAAADHAV